MSKKTSGFTIVEVLVVVAILGILASIIILTLRNARENAESAAVAANVRNYELALHNYYTDTGQFPIVGGKACVQPTGETCIYAGTTYLPDAYLNSIIQQYQAIAPGPTIAVGPPESILARGVLYTCLNPDPTGYCAGAIITYAIKGNTCILKNATTTGPTTGGIMCNVPLP